MIRPVLRAGKEAVSTVVETQAVPAPAMHPNPGSEACHMVLTETTDVRVYDLQGRLVADLPRSQAGVHVWRPEGPGVYVITGVNAHGHVWTSRWISQP
jgi:hypothetical protein